MPQFSAPGSVRYCRVDEGLQLFHQHAAIGIRLSAAETLVFDRRVLIDSLNPRVVNANDDQRLNRTGLDQRIRGFPHAPIVSLDERGLGIKEVLAILHVQHRETGDPPSASYIGGR